MIAGIRCQAEWYAADVLKLSFADSIADGGRRHWCCVSPAARGDESKARAYEACLTEEPFAVEVRLLDENWRFRLQELDYEGQDRESFCGLCFTFETQPGESFYGLGGKFNSLDQRGRVVDIISRSSLLATDDYSYLPIPILISTRGYGLFIQSYRLVRFDLRGTEGKCHILLDDGEPTVFILLGETVDQILRSYARITGLPVRLPSWVFGIIQGQNFSSAGDVKYLVNSYRKRNLPLSVVFFDWKGWERYQGELTFKRELGDPRRLIAWMKSQGVQPMLWETSWLSKHSPWCRRFSRKGFFPTDAAGKPMDEGPGYRLDLTNPEVHALRLRRNRELLQMGVRALLVDFGETASLGVNHHIRRDAQGNIISIRRKRKSCPPNLEEEVLQGIYYQGRAAREIGNRYAAIYHEMVHQAVCEENLMEQVLLLSRSGISGIGHSSAVFTGDQGTSFSGMKAALRAMLSLGLSGVSFVSHNMGGWFGKQSKEVFVRWMQMGMFSPLSSLWCAGGPITPWSFDQETLDIFSYFAWLRVNLMPYILKNVEQTCCTGLPLARALVVDYGWDPASRSVETQYLFGEDILVAPVLSQTRRRSVYLPPGTWCDFWSARVRSGARRILCEAPLSRLPLWVKQDAIIPMVLNQELEVGVDPGKESITVFACYRGGGAYQEVDGTTIECHPQAGGLIIKLRPRGKQRIGLILHGFPAAAVKLADQELPLQRKLERAAMGWYVDQRGSTRVKLPPWPEDGRPLTLFCMQGVPEEGPAERVQ